MKDLKQTLKRQIEQLEIENIFHRKINQYIKKLSNKEIVRHIEEVGKCTQKIEETLFKLLGIVIELPVELIEIDEEARIENAIIPNDQAYKITRAHIDKVGQLFERK